MKKVLIIIPNMRMGGAQKALLSFLNEFDESRLKVSLLLFDTDGELIDLIPQKVNIIYLENYYKILTDCKYNNVLIKDFLFSIFKFDYSYFYRRFKLILKYKKNQFLHEEQRIWQCVKEYVESFDAYEYDVCLSYMQGTSTYYLVDKIKTNSPKLSMINTDYIKANYSVVYDRKYFEKLTKIACVSENGTVNLKKLFSEIDNKFCFVGDVVSEKEILSKCKEKAPYKLENREFIIVSCGRLAVNVKGYDLSIKVAKKLMDAGYKYKWYIIGDGDGREWMEEEIYRCGLNDNYILLGSLLNPYPAIYNADLFVHCSRFEGKPISVREAKILKKAIISTNYDSIYSVLENDYDGYIVEMDEKAIYDKIIELINDPKKIEKVKNNIKNDNSNKEIEEYYDFLGV